MHRVSHGTKAGVCLTVKITFRHALEGEARLKNVVVVIVRHAPKDIIYRPWICLKIVANFVRPYLCKSSRVMP